MKTPSYIRVWTLIPQFPLGTGKEALPVSYHLLIVPPRDCYTSSQQQIFSVRNKVLHYRDHLHDVAGKLMHLSTTPTVVLTKLVWKNPPRVFKKFLVLLNPRHSTEKRQIENIKVSITSCSLSAFCVCFLRLLWAATLFFSLRLTFLSSSSWPWKTNPHFSELSLKNKTELRF